MTLASRILYICFVSAVLTVTIAATNSNIASAKTWNEYIFNQGTNKCLAVIDFNTESPVIQEPCFNTPSQHWSFTTIDGNGTWQLWNPQVDLCAARTGLDNFSPVVMRSCDDPSTHWNTQVVNFTSFQLFSFHLLSIEFIVVGLDFEGNPIYSNACLDLENGSPADGVHLQMWSCNFQTNNQIWVSQDVFE